VAARAKRRVAPRVRGFTPARFERLESQLADVDRAVVLDQHDGLLRISRLLAIDAVELFKESNEVVMRTDDPDPRGMKASGSCPFARDRRFKKNKRRVSWSRKIWLSECSTRLWWASALSAGEPPAVKL
jgi:hypothetical protein